MTNAIILILFTSTFFAVMFGYASCKKLTKQLKSTQIANEHMRKIIQSQQTHQQKINITMHDKLGANLSALNIYIDLAKQYIPANTLQIIQKILKESVEETRNLIKKNDTTDV